MYFSVYKSVFFRWDGQDDGDGFSLSCRLSRFSCQKSEDRNWNSEVGLRPLRAVGSASRKP